MIQENKSADGSSSLAQMVAAEFSALPQVEAVALAGSRTAQVSDATSDFDIYVYTREDIPVTRRAAIASRFAEQIELDNQFWEPGDEWIESSSGVGVDLIYRTPQWIEEQLERVLVKHQASVGYSTCFWCNVLTSRTLYDKNGWYGRLKLTADQPYPEPLRQAIIAKNHPILRRNISAYTHQIEKAVMRQDRVSVNHRVAALLASYFDILFAINRLPHPGEKRLVEWAIKSCSMLPRNMEPHLDDLLRAASLEWQNQDILKCAHRLIDALDELLRQESLLKFRP